MSEGTAGPQRRPRGRWFDVVSTIVIGVVIVIAALIPAITANSGETTAVQGEVTLAGAPVPFFPVGFWTTGTGIVTTTRTDANGRFTLDVPDTLDGYAYAGTTPDSQHAIIDVGGQEIVRGVINANPAGTPASALYQGRPTATAHSLSNGAAQVHFRLQQAGRISGTSPVKASGLRAVQIRRADNSVVQTLTLDSRSRFRSMPLTPGQYGVVLIPKSPGLPTVANAVVQSAKTTAVTLAKPVAGATILGTVTTGPSAAGAVGAGVPVLLEQAGAVLAATKTSTSGDWSFAGIGAGDYSVEVGRYDEPAASSASASSVVVPIPGATATPTPTATATAAPSTPVAPTTAAIEPVERTADAVLPQTFAVTVSDLLGEVSVDTTVEQAGSITGTVSRTDPVTGAESAGFKVLVEEAATGRMVRTATAASNGSYTVGGLDPGKRYRVYAVTEPDDPSLAEMGETTAVASATGASAEVVISEPALTLTGTVSGTTGGKVVAGDAALLQRTSTIDSSGAYALHGLVPGAYPIVVTATGRKAADPVGVVVAADALTADLQPGPSAAVFKGWFISSGAGVPAITGTAVDADGDVATFGPTTSGGHVEVKHLVPGTYAYDATSFRGSAPALDGPWYFAAPTGSFTLSSGATTDVGPIVLHLFSH